MKNLHPAYGAPSLLLLLLLSAGSAQAEAEPREIAPEAERVAVAEEGRVYGADERVVETLEQKGGQIGYSFLDVRNYGGRAAPYGYLHSSRSGGLFYRSLEKDGNFELEGNFLNENDYHGDLLIDYKGDYRLHLRTEALYHNLDRELLFSQPFNSARVDPPLLGQPASYTSFQDPATDYGITVTQDIAEFRYRLHNFPLHVNLGYWRLVREGTLQQRYADTGFEGDTNRILAEARQIRQVTQEGRLGVDAHLGWVDLIYDFRVRAFEDQVPIPTANYLARNSGFGTVATPESVGGVQQHNENPDSIFFSNTVKLHTSLTGGIVGSASYSIDQRENLSRLIDTAGIKHAQVNLQNAAGDFVYTPCKEFSLAVKYRRQELENDNRGALLSSNFVDPQQSVKAPVDSTKDLVLVNMAFKPLTGITLNTEYRGEMVHRDHVSDLPSTTTWALPANTATQKGSLALLYHPIKGLRITAKYAYATTDHPAYGNSYQQHHEGQLLATYTASRWGASANVRARREWNDSIEHFIVSPPPFSNPAGWSASSPLSRTRAVQDVNLSAWVNPVKRLALSANYGWLSNSVDQAVLFTGVAVGSEAASNYLSRAHVYGVNATLAATEDLDLALSLQQIRSQSAFSPQQVTFAGNSGDTSGIREITRQDTVISSVAWRGEYRFTRQFSGKLEYTLQDYHERNQAYSYQNGTVHAVVAYLAAKW
ncbi:outer membrane channel lipoprotein [Geomonas limicola]|uniref:Outer membrane channel lipoprotein n=1 Tax=Geomonas limicola TaxID=2740186 RepID=A0A6V8NFE0_9BACT|nr:hypothetical protein [Geomonas limicola]GFO70534.1 outer membrane channel lipoprotein [Geomonas limicola]